MVQGGKQLLQEQDKHLADVLNPKQKIMASMLIISARFDCLCIDLTSQLVFYKS